MDSLTQFVLGASVGAACLGKRHGLRKAALIGGILGTLPDLDVFYDYGGPVENFVQHRSVTHSLIMQTLVTPVIGEGLYRLLNKLQANKSAATSLDHSRSGFNDRWQVWLAVWLCLVTHALLDSFTIYGTQLLWPLTAHPFGIGSVFIIDPLYTMPLLVMTIWALVRGQWTARFRKGITLAFVLSTAYLGWSLGAQTWMIQRTEALLAHHQIPAEKLLVGPLLMTTGLWKATVLAGPSYLNIYLPFFGDDQAAPIYRHARWPDGMTCQQVADLPLDPRLSAFSKGFYEVTASPDGKIYQADLRMGVTPNYVFRFRVGNRAGDAAWRDSPASRVRSGRQMDGDLDWLMRIVMGHPDIRPAERNAVITPSQLDMVSLSSACKLPAIGR